MRVRAESGLEGVGLAFARGLPLARIVADAVSPLLLGLDARLPEQVRTTLTGVALADRPTRASWPRR